MKTGDKILADIDANGLNAKGKVELVKHLSGERLNPREMAIAKCYDCMGFYSDGRGQDCEVSHCPLYPLMPYRPGEKYKSKNLTDEQRKEMSLRAAKQGFKKAK